MADFITKCTIPKGKPEDDPMLEVSEKQWVLYVDGVSNASGFGAGLVIVNPEGGDIQYALRFGFSSTNNEAEYNALIIGLAIAKELGVQHLKAYSDSQLVIGHVLNENEAKKENMKKYLQKVMDLTSTFCRFTIQ